MIRIKISSNLSAILLAGLLVVAVGCAGSGEGPTTAPDPRDNTGELLRSPPSFRSSGGELDVHLRVGYTQTNWRNDEVYLRTYNGRLVGPTLRVKPGDTLKVDLHNRMPVQTEHSGHDSVHHHGEDGEFNDPHDFNVTNLHTHGLWVSPSGISDNVLLAVGPGESQHYEIEIPRTHAPGTHWYHPHKHGSVALQSASGMAGLLIIEGGLDDVPEIAAAREQVFVLQQFAHTEEDCESIDPVPEDVDLAGVSCIETYDYFGPGSWDDLDRPTSINGQVQPTLTLRPGEVQRWRFAHAGVRESINLAIIKPLEVDKFLEDLPTEIPDNVTPADLGVSHQSLHVISEDGIAYGRIDEYSDFHMEPGYRMDALVKIAERGDYLLVDLPANPGDGLLATAERLRILAYIKVVGGSVKMDLPSSDSLAALAPYKHVEDDEITGCQKTVFNAGGGNFTVNDLAYDPMYPACKVPLGKAEEWQLSSDGANHPFHIHVNPFEVQDLNEKGYMVWKDTILVEPPVDPDAPYEPDVTVRTRYRRFTGEFVMHCHILDHEDQGMMINVEVMKNPPKPGTKGTICVPCDEE